jgi:DNA repair photolyase
MDYQCYPGTMAKEIQVKTALHHHGRQMPTNWDLNTYRGCSNGCTYCFAQYSHSYMESDNFFDDVFVKTNVAQALDSELSKKSWKGEPIKIGGVTDSYQPLEKKYALMPDVLKVLIRHQNPVLIATKSDLILREIDLIASLAELTDVAIATTVTAMDEQTRKKIEPAAPPSIKRFEMLKKLGEMGCETAVLCTPIIPFITDGKDNLERIFSQTKEHNVGSILAWSLHLRGSTRTKFLNFLKKSYPKLEQKIAQMYQTSNAPKSYRQDLRRTIEGLRKKYDLFETYSPRLFPAEDKQLSLF